MSLFTVNRYFGDEDSGEENGGTDDRVQAILHKIHKQANDKRKRSLSVKKKIDKDSADSQSSGSEGEEATEKPRKTKKRAKEQQGEDSDSGTQNTPIKRFKKTEESKESTYIESKQSKKKSNNVSENKTQKKKDKHGKKTRAITYDNDDSYVIENNQASGSEPNELLAAAAAADVTLEGDDSHHEGNSEDEWEGEGTTREQNKEIGGFTIIGDVRKKKVEKVQRVLPDWLASPALVTNDLKDSVAGLETVGGLEEDVIQRLRDNGVTHFFPVQRLVIPVLLGTHCTGHLLGPAGYRPSDICCSAPTGSGKTLAFVLPIVQALRHRVVRQVRALVVLPVRDLATQVYKVFSAYCAGTSLKVGLLIGHKSFRNEQLNLIRKGSHGLHVQADIVVATPGRLVDHIKQTPGFSLHHLRYLVIDEADRMMEHVKQDWIVQVEQAVYGPGSPRTPPTLLTAATFNKMEMPLQKLLFSATLSQNPEKLQQLNLFKPRLFTAVVPAGSKDENKTEDAQTKGEFIGKFTTPAGLSEYMVQARDAGEKPLLVLYFLHRRQFRHVLVFTNSVEATHRLYHLTRLVGGLEVQEFSSGLHAMQRNRILKRFAAGKIDVLICSDAMARGMDVENVQCVISYDHAPYVKTYIHRIGRTARAGKVGTAITLLEKKEVYHFKKMVREAGKAKVTELKVSRGDLRPQLADYQRALKELPDVLEAEKRNR